MSAICGDPTCEGPGCQSEAIDAWEARQQAEARAIVRAELGLPPEHVDFGGGPTDTFLGSTS